MWIKLDRNMPMNIGNNFANAFMNFLVETQQTSKKNLYMCFYIQRNEIPPKKKATTIKCQRQKFKTC